MRIEWLDSDYTKARVTRGRRVALIEADHWSTNWVFCSTKHKVGWWVGICLDMSRSHWKRYHAAIGWEERRKKEKPLEWVEIPKATLIERR